MISRVCLLLFIVIIFPFSTIAEKKDLVIEKKVKALLLKMTLEEKVEQLGQPFLSAKNQVSLIGNMGQGRVVSIFLAKQIILYELNFNEVVEAGEFKVWAGANYVVHGNVIEPAHHYWRVMHVPVTFSVGDYTTPVRHYIIKVKMEELFTSIRLFVDPDGDDSASGAMHEPLRTLQGALTKLKEMRKTEDERCAGDFEIALWGGVYVLDKTVLFDHDDTGERFARVII